MANREGFSASSNLIEKSFYDFPVSLPGKKRNIESWSGLGLTQAVSEDSLYLMLLLSFLFEGLVLHLC